MGCGGSKPQDKPAAKGGNAGSAPMPTKEVKEGGFSKGQFIMDNTGKVDQFYDMEKKKLGEGSYGTVCKAKHKSTGAVRAVKSISKAQMKNLDRFKQVMKMMDHPNIIKLYESFEDHKNIYLVMELCTGGEMFDRIIEAGHFTEVQAATVMQQVVRAIFYMHEQHVCHRDLKPENFLFTNKDPVEKSTLKIIDFGLSCVFTENQVLTTKAGTPYYVAPQVLAGKYDQLSDIWSCGVIMYVLLCGYPPFFGETDAEVLSKVRLGNFSFNQADWKNISEDAKNLIRMMLKMQPRDRCTADQALNNDWIKKKAPKATGGEIGASMVENLKGFRSQNKLKKVALHVIASQLGEDQIKTLRETFMKLDSNGDGKMTVSELKEGISKAGLKEIPPDLKAIMDDIDADGSGEIDYTEFLAATLDKKVYMQEDVCWNAFKNFDRNNDGKISQDELKVILGDPSVQNQANVEIAEILKQFDGNGDGFIDFQEFMQLMRGETQKPGEA